jgi:flagellar basal body P-ring formation protein FlgA
MWRLMLLLIPVEALADSLVAARTIRARAMLTAEDVTLVAADIPGALADASLAIGQEARVAIYPGRAIRAGDIGPSAIVERNQVVPLAYLSGALVIMTEGRALDRGGAGDVISVMNLASRTKVFGQIGADGVVRVGPAS